MDQISLSRCRVLYLGSAIPLETAIGIEAIQAPCRDRFDNVDPSNRASGIDSVLSVYSSGIMLQYTGDPSSKNWFPIQTLHVCAAVKAVSGAGPLRFVSLDTAAAQRSSNPPMFACIMRRTKGIKVLECHVFICKSAQAAMALVQSCTHAFQHKEGWSSEAAAGGARLVSAGAFNNSSGGGKQGSSFYDDHLDLVQKFDVSMRFGDQPAQQQQQMMAVVPMNPPGAPVPVIPQTGAYFADWAMNAGQPLMIIPDSPFYPGEAAMCQHRRKKKKKQPKKKKDDEEEETIFVKRSQLEGRRGPSGKNVYVEEIITSPQPRPAPQPQIVIIPQQPNPPAPDVKNQQNPKSDVVVYAPQVIEANRNLQNYQLDDRMTDMVDYHPDTRSFRQRNDGRVYDSRADNRIFYNRDDVRNAYYRSDQRSLRNAEDNRRFDYRADNRSNREDNRRFDYRADNRSNREDNRMALAYAQGYDGGYYYDEDRMRDDEFARGYYNAQVEAYNNYLQNADAYSEDYGYDDYGYYPEGYYPQPGYTDDYGGEFYVQGYGDYYGQGQAGYPAQGAAYVQPNGYLQVADGLGYYP